MRVKMMSKIYSARNQRIRLFIGIPFSIMLVISLLLVPYQHSMLLFVPLGPGNLAFWAYFKFKRSRDSIGRSESKQTPKNKTYK